MTVCPEGRVADDSLVLRAQRCDFFWADFDRCEQEAGHGDDHGTTAPVCGAPMPGTDVTCDASVWHIGNHRATLRWQRESSECVEEQA